MNQDCLLLELYQQKQPQVIRETYRNLTPSFIDIQDLKFGFELYDEEIAEQMYDSLSEHFDVIELKLSEYDDLSWAYINCLQTQDFIIIPGIGNAITDAEAMKQYRELFPEYEDNIFMVQMREFIEEHGGALNCLTWTIQENYLKMLCKGAHIPLVGLEDNKDCPPYQEEIDDLFRKIKHLEN